MVLEVVHVVWLVLLLLFSELALQLFKILILALQLLFALTNPHHRCLLVNSRG
mgnify:CR=1 FL=1